MKLSSWTGLILPVIFIVLFCLTDIRAAPGDLDPTFNAAAFGLNNGTVSVMEKQSDGKILVGGTFLDINGHATTAVARFNVDGTIDTTFSSPDFGNGTGVGGAILAIGVQSDGRIVIGGSIFGVNGVFGKKLYRLNSNGSLDTTFQAPLFDNFIGEGIVHDLKIQSDDKIVAGGNFGTTAGGASNRLVRLNADGTLDGTFANASSVGVVWGLEIQPDGKILTGGGSLVRLLASGANDPSFAGVSTGGSGTIYEIKRAPDGKILIGGQFNNLNGVTVRNLAKLDPDGSLDLNFNLNGLGPNDLIGGILALDDGKIIISGYFTTYNATPRQKIARLNFDGTLDTSFQNNPQFTTFYGGEAELLEDGKILLGGSVSPDTASPLVRLQTDGSLDTSVGYTVSNAGRVREILKQPDGKTLIAGQFSAVNGVRRNSLARLNADGSLDASFVPYLNNIAVSFSINAVALQADGKILVGAGGFLQRLNSDGTHDASFPMPLGSNTNIFDLQLTANNQILVGGDLRLTNSQVRKILRLNSNGTIDASFGVDQPNGTVFDMQIQPDGKLVIGGAFTQVGAALRGKFARLTGEGALDATFNPPGGAGGGDVYNVELQPDGKVLLAGSFTSVNASANQRRIGRVNADGTLDALFLQSVADGQVNALKLQPDGKILIGGNFTVVGATPRNGFARLNPDSSLDNSLNATANLGVLDIQLESDGKILIGGEFTKFSGVSKIRIARLLNSGAVPARTPFDYDGDNKADISVFRASENKWYIYQSSNGAVRENVFGLPGDVPVPADYDGDLKTDVAIYRPSTGAWWYLSSISGAQISVVFGLPDGIPRPSDIDGDGKTDFVFYRPSNNTWYRLSATGVTATPFVFGVAGDKPLIGDFDGDGRSDPAVFRPSTGDWWYAPSGSASGQFAVVHWGAAGDIPSPADVDADGKTDFVVYRPSNGGWYILRSGEQNYTILQFGLPEDKPVMADYDGDGKADVAVFRPSTGVWYLLQTTSGFGALQWGNFTDTPTPNAFLP